MAKVQITETILRDAHQSQAATRMRLEEMLPAAPMLDKVGYYSLEAWGGATFDTCLRFLNEDPWERLRALRKVADDERRQTVIGMSLLLGIALPKALSGLTGGASVFFGNNIMVGVFSAIILNALFVALPDLVAKHRAPASVDVPAADPADGTGAAAYDER